MTRNTPATTVTVERVTDSQRVYFDTPAKREHVYRVTGRRVSGVVSAMLAVDASGAPTHRPIDPATGYNRRGDTPTADYVGLRVDASPRAPHSMADALASDANVDTVTGRLSTTHVDPLRINGVVILDAQRSATFHPVAVDVDVHDYNGVHDRSQWNRSGDGEETRALAQRMGYPYASGVIGTDGVRRPGVFVISSPSYADRVSDSASRVLDAITSAILADYVHRGEYDDDGAEILAGVLRSERERARDLADRWEDEHTRVCDALVTFGDGVRAGSLVSFAGGVQ